MDLKKSLSQWEPYYFMQWYTGECVKIVPEKKSNNFDLIKYLLIGNS